MYRSLAFIGFFFLSFLSCEGGGLKAVYGFDNLDSMTDSPFLLTESTSDDISEPLPIEIKGNTVDSSETLLKLPEVVTIREQLTQEEITEDQALQQIAEVITNYYLSQGYITSTAEVVNGMIQVSERGIADIWLQTTNEQGKIQKTRLSHYICQRVKRGIKTPFNTRDLESQLRLMQLDPLIANIEGTLRSQRDSISFDPKTQTSCLGTSQETSQESNKSNLNTENSENSENGQAIANSTPEGTIVVVTVTEGGRFSGLVEVDNYSPPSIGSERIGGEFTANVTNLGDEISAFYYQTLEGYSSRTQIRYQVPVNPKNGTVALRWYREFNQVIQPPFDTLDIKGTADWYEIFYRQPIIQDFRHEFALSGGLTHRDGQTFTFAGPTPFGFGPEDDGTSRTSVIKFGQDYTRRDQSGIFAVRSLLNFGTGLLDATRNVPADNGDSIPDGQFFSWYFQVQRLQVLSRDHLLIVQGDLQLSSDALLPDQQFVIGGGQSVRGYRQNVRTGDNGFRFSIEDRWTLWRTSDNKDYIFQLAPFLDMGSVWNAGDNPNLIQEKRFIIGLGMGAILQLIPGLNARIDYAPPLIHLEDQGTNAQDKGFYFSLQYQKRF